MAQCNCLELGEKLIIIDGLNTYKEKVQKEREEQTSEIELFSSQVMLSNINDVKDTIERIEVCKITR